MEYIVYDKDDFSRTRRAYIHDSALAHTKRRPSSNCKVNTILLNVCKTVDNITDGLDELINMENE